MTHPIVKLFVYLLASFPLAAAAGSLNTETLTGEVKSGTTSITCSTVTLYQAGTTKRTPIELESTGCSGSTFTIDYLPPGSDEAVLYLVADGERTAPKQTSRVQLVTVLGTTPPAQSLVINERTTVAAGYAMARLASRRGQIGGPSVGLLSAAATVPNLVDIATGNVGTVLSQAPNGSETTTMQAFNSLANLLIPCVRGNDRDSCFPLFSLANPPRGQRPSNTWRAIVNIAQNPWLNVQDLFTLSQEVQAYTPALASPPDAWTLAIRYGDQTKLDGPGNIAFDGDGNAWVNNNYSNVPPHCGSLEFFKLTPSGTHATFGGPSSDGGLYGAGFGIAVDPFSHVWVSNFGFQGTDCVVPTDEQVALSQSVSRFNKNGEAVSPSRDGDDYGGLRSSQADIEAPQGTLSDDNGNIWITNCGNDSVTKIPFGVLEDAQNFSSLGLVSPFALTIDTKGRIWVSGNNNNSIVALDPDDGSVIQGPITQNIHFPKGIAADSRGNVWIANSAIGAPPCPGRLASDEKLPDGLAAIENPPPLASVAVRHRNGDVEMFKDVGGIFLPWGIAIDGKDNVWVANFGGPASGLVGVVHLCGVRRGACPPGLETGDAFSPDTGYTSDGLTRNTGIAIDPAGNVWLTNNWVIDALSHLDNPGGHEVVVLIGVAEPVETPLYGPPRRLRSR